MIVRLLLKFGFKACLPLAATLGIIFYMGYMHGGDPVNSARKIIAQSGAGTSQPGALERMKGSVAGTFDSIFGGDEPSIAAAKPGGSGVYRWEDTSGATHYGSYPPADALNVRPVKLRSNPAPRQVSPNPVSSDAVPGVPGVDLPAGVQLPAGVDYTRVLGDIDEQE